MAASAEDAAHPFLFYGHRPSDWTPGPLGYLLRFAAPPSASAREAFAVAWSRGIPAATGSFAEHFLFAESPWALLTFRPLDGSAFAPEAFFPAVEAMLRAIHAIAPLAEVIFTNARNGLGLSAWDRDSLARAPQPTLIGPARLPFENAFGREVIDRLDALLYGPDYAAAYRALPQVDVHEDEVFRAALVTSHRVRAEAQVNARSKALAARGADAAGDEVTLETVDLAPRPHMPDPPALADAAVLVRCPSGHVIGLAPRVPDHVAVLDPGAVEPHRFVPSFKLLPYVGNCAFSPDGARGVLQSMGVTYAIDLATGATRVVPVPPGFTGATFLDARRLVGGDAKAMHLLELLDDDPWVRLRDTVSANGSYAGVGGGRFVFSCGDRATLVFAVHEDKFVRIGKIAGTSRTHIHMRDDDVMIDDPRLGGVVRVAHLDAALAAALAKKKPARAKSRKS